MSTTNKETKKIKREEYAALPLVRRNFIIMAVAGLLIILGFALMVGGGTGDATFSNEIFSVRRIVIAPMLAFLGFVLMGIAIIIKPGQKKADDAENK